MTGASLGHTAGEALADFLGLDKNDPGHAQGGVSEGSNTGHIEKLHGIEAVVPLPDGKTIPVNITQAPATNDNSELIGLLRELIAKTSTGHEKFDDMVKTLKDGVAINNDILQNMA